MSNFWVAVVVTLGLVVGVAVVMPWFSALVCRYWDWVERKVGR